MESKKSNFSKEKVLMVQIRKEMQLQRRKVTGITSTISKTDQPGVRNLISQTADKHLQESLILAFNVAI